MIRDLEGLIARLVLLTACAGEKGYPVANLLSDIFVLLNVQEGDLPADKTPAAFHSCTPTTVRAASAIWRWIADRNDISVGKDRSLNDLSLADAVCQAYPGSVLRNEDVDNAALKQESQADGGEREADFANIETEHSSCIRLYASENTMWESIAGHGVDYKRLPRLEWVLLQGIASTASDGILQGDLGRLVGQDKRSVPKRTDTLVSKGYIIKRTTLVRGTKTSKLWLKFLAPPTPQDRVNAAEASTEMTFSRYLLVDTLDAVPWHTKWTNDSIDYTALATTIMATCKEWAVMRLQHLKSKLGVLGMRWQMKVVSKICRFLAARGAIEYVAATHDNKVYKDCIRFNRGLSARDWSIFLATGKRSSKSAKGASTDRADDHMDVNADVKIGRAPLISHCPAWTVDVPLSTSIANLLQQFNEQGLTNQDICGMTVGSTFTRYISGLTSTLSDSDVQPAHPTHLRVRNEHIRQGKVASFRYYMGQKIDANFPGISTSPRRVTTPENKQYGFASAEGKKSTVNDISTLSELCQRGLAQHNKRGRPRKLLPNNDGAARASTNNEAATASLNDEIGDGDIRLRRAARNVYSYALQSSPLAREHVLPGPSNGHLGQASTDADEQRRDTAEVPLMTAERHSPMNVSSRAQGSTRKRQDQVPVDSTAEPSERPFKCDKCGGGWKNELGLKYHLEKSKTSCNPAFMAAQSRRELKQSDARGHLRNRHGTKQKRLTAFASSDRASNLIGEDRARGKRSKIRRAGSVASSEALIAAIRDTAHPVEPDSTLHDSLYEDKAATIHKKNESPLLAQDERLPRKITAAKSRRALTSEAALQFGEAQQSTGVKSSAVDDTPLARYPTYGFTSGLFGEASVAGAQNLRHVPDKLKSTKYTNETIEHGIKEIMEQNGGYAPGGVSLEAALRDKWEQQSPGQSAPSSRQIGTIIKRMQRRKTIVEHWHGFRAQNGVFAKVQILMSPLQTAFSTEAVQLVERLQGVYPCPLLLGRSVDREKDATPDKKGGGRGRRQLASGVAVLDAPVYAAQMVAKHGRELDTPLSTSAKRRRKLERSSVNAALGISDSERRALWPTERAELSDSFSLLDLNSLSAPYIAMQADYGNNYAIEPYLPRVAFPKRDSTLVDESEQPQGVAQWQFCRRFASALSKHGWLPDSDWYAWASDYTASQTMQQKTPPWQSKHHFFRDTLKLCADLEAETSYSAVTSSSHNQFPHEVFISFIAGTSKAEYPTLQWESSAEPDRHLPEAGALMQDDEDSYTMSEAEEDTACSVGVSAARHQRRTETETAQALAKIKRVALVTRRLTGLPQNAERKYLSIESSGLPPSFDHDEVMAAFIAVRTLIGGLEKAIDWGLLLTLFPNIGLTQLRRFWAKAKKEKSPYITKFTEDFQDRLVHALRNDEIPMIDHTDLTAYNWKSLIRWTMRISNQDKLQMPSSKYAFARRFDLADSGLDIEDWREKFFHTQSSIFTRFEAATLEAGALSMCEMTQNGSTRQPEGFVDVARSWVRSLCGTGETRYSPQDVKAKFASLSNENVQNSSSSLRKAIEELTKERVICKSKKSPLGGRPYRLNESYIAVLAKVSHRTKYHDAAVFKEKLDSAFRSKGMIKVPYALEDGAVMALTCLNASGKIRIKTVNAPKIPFGFEPGNYESRKYPKSYYHIALQVEPTNSYEYSENIPALQAAMKNSPPNEGLRREIPQWIDFFGGLDADRWADLLGAFLFVLNIRGPMSLACICNAIAPALEHFEAQLIREWGVSTGILKTWKSGASVTLGEWWWLAVHPQRLAQGTSEG